MTPRTPGSARKEEENPHGNGDLYGFRDSKGITSGERPGQSCCRAGIATLDITKKNKRFWLLFRADLTTALVVFTWNCNEPLGYMAQHWQQQLFFF
jgi:hypothetical protein